MFPLSKLFLGEWHRNDLGYYVALRQSKEPPCLSHVLFNCKNKQTNKQQIKRDTCWILHFNLKAGPLPVLSQRLVLKGGFTIDFYRLKKKWPSGSGLAEHIALEGKGFMGGEPTRCLALSSYSVQTAWSCGQLPTEMIHRARSLSQLAGCCNPCVLLPSEEKLSLDFLPVLSSSQQLKCLKNHKQSPPKNGGQSSQIWSIKIAHLLQTTP